MSNWTPPSAQQDPRPYKVYRGSVVGRTLYDTQPTREAAESSIRTGKIDYPNDAFYIFPADTL